jgi:hypothetical protein
MVLYPLAALADLDHLVGSDDMIRHLLAAVETGGLGFVCEVEAAIKVRRLAYISPEVRSF